MQYVGRSTWLMGSHYGAISWDMDITEDAVVEADDKIYRYEVVLVLRRFNKTRKFPVYKNLLKACGILLTKKAGRLPKPPKSLPTLAFDTKRYGGQALLRTFGGTWFPLRMEIKSRKIDAIASRYAGVHNGRRPDKVADVRSVGLIMKNMGYRLEIMP